MVCWLQVQLEQITIVEKHHDRGLEGFDSVAAVKGALTRAESTTRSVRGQRLMLKQLASDQVASTTAIAMNQVY